MRQQHMYNYHDRTLSKRVLWHGKTEQFTNQLQWLYCVPVIGRHCGHYIRSRRHGDNRVLYPGGHQVQ